MARVRVTTMPYIVYVCYFATAPPPAAGRFSDMIPYSNGKMPFGKSIPKRHFPFTNP